MRERFLRRTEFNIRNSLGKLAQVFAVGADVGSQGDPGLIPVPVRRNGNSERRRTVLAGGNIQIQ